VSTRASMTTALAISGLLLLGDAFAAPNAPAMAPGDTELKTLYWQGHESLKVGDYELALARFKDLESRLKQRDPASADATVYWQAYTLVRSKRLADARATVARLHREFPQSRWSDEADALVTPQGAGAVAGPVGSGDKQAEAVIEGALSAPAERAAPLLMQIVKGDYSPKIKKRALFVLSQLGDADSLTRVAEVAQGSDPALGLEAIQMLGVSGAGPELRKVYGASTNVDTRRAVLRALGVAGATEQLAEVAKSAADPALRREALSGLGVAGGVDALVEVAQSNADISLRREAIENLGVAGATERLIALYRQVNTPELRNEVIKAVQVSSGSAALLELYNRAKTPEEKQVLMRIQQEMSHDESDEK